MKLILEVEPLHKGTIIWVIS